jgi:hypothetical protein
LARVFARRRAASGGWHAVWRCGGATKRSTRSGPTCDGTAFVPTGAGGVGGGAGGRSTDDRAQKRAAARRTVQLGPDRVATAPLSCQPAQLLAAAVNSAVVAGENPTVGGTVWLPAESVAPGR